MIYDDDEILQRKDKIIIGTMLAFVFLLMLLLNHLGYFENKDRDHVLSTAFKTTVVAKYIDEKNHMSPQLKLSDGGEMTNYFPKHDVELNVGDSLVKLKKSTDMQVYRDKIMIYSINLLEK